LSEFETSMGSFNSHLSKLEISSTRNQETSQQVQQDYPDHFGTQNIDHELLTFAEASFAQEPPTPISY